MIDVTINVRDSKGISLEVRKEFPFDVEFGTDYFDSCLAEMVAAALKDAQDVSEGARKVRER